MPWWSPCNFRYPTSTNLATKAGLYSLENGNTGSQPYTPAPLHADCHEIIETAATLLVTLSQPIFEPLINAPTAKSDAELFYFKGSGADGVREYTTEGFLVLKGSKGRIESVAGIRCISDERFRNKLVTEGILAAQDGMLVFTRNHVFSSPSMATLARMGCTANGWMEWNAANGKTLHELKRRAVAAVV